MAILAGIFRARLMNRTFPNGGAGKLSTARRWLKPSAVLLTEAEAFVFPTNRTEVLVELKKIRVELVSHLDGVSQAIAGHEATASGSGDAKH